MKQRLIQSVLPLVFICRCLHGVAVEAAPAETLRTLVMQRVDAEYPSLFSIYTNLHAHPELSFMEVRTAALVAGELRRLGFTVTEKGGGTGVVGVLTNGTGPTLKTCVTSMTAAVLELMGNPAVGQGNAGEEGGVGRRGLSGEEKL